MRRERIVNLLSENAALWKVYGKHMVEYCIKELSKRGVKKTLEEDVIKIKKNYEKLIDEINDMMDITEATEKELIKLTGEK